MTLSVQGTNQEYRFNAVEPFKIVSYPYYRAGKILTQKYSVLYDDIFNLIKGFDFKDYSNAVANSRINRPDHTKIQNQEDKQSDNKAREMPQNVENNPLISANLSVNGEAPPNSNLNHNLSNTEKDKIGNKSDILKDNSAQKNPETSSNKSYSQGSLTIKSYNNYSQVDWARTHKLMFSLSIGGGSGHSINTHILTSFSQTPGFGSDEYIFGSFFSFSCLTASYYHFKNITFHLIIVPRFDTQKIGDVKDMKSRSFMLVNSLKTQVNLYHNEEMSNSQADGNFQNIYLGYGIGLGLFYL